MQTVNEETGHFAGALQSFKQAVSKRSVHAFVTVWHRSLIPVTHLALFLN
jgi:hypothetical protein